MEAPGFSTAAAFFWSYMHCGRLKKMDGNDSHHQCAQGEPQRTASLRRIVVLIFPIFPEATDSELGGLAESVA